MKIPVKIHDIDTAAAAAVLRVLGNATRLQIVLHLLRGEMSVGDIERELGLRQPSLSQQLAELRDAGLVVGRREAKSVRYSLAGPAQHRLAAALFHGFAHGEAAMPSLAPTSVTMTRQAHLGAVFARVTGAA